MAAVRQIRSDAGRKKSTDGGCDTSQTTAQNQWMMGATLVTLQNKTIDNGYDISQAAARNP